MNEDILEYDTLGRLDTVTDENAREVSYEYDKDSRRNRMDYPDGSWVTYDYDDLGRLTDIYYNGQTTPLVHYDYDRLSRRTETFYNYDADAAYEGKISYTYADSTRTGCTAGNQLGNWLAKLENDVDNDSTADITFDYLYDKAGNRTEMKIDNDNNLKHLYEYDNTYQAIDIDYPGSWGFSDATISYDDVHNRLTYNDGTQTSYVANALNQYTDVGAASYTYDDNGNLTGDGTYTYEYDAENRLTAVKKGANTLSAYTYDAFGRRSCATIAAAATTYCYDGAQVLAEYEGAATPARTFIYGPGIDEPVCMITFDAAGDETERYFYYFDGLGSVAALVRASDGAIVERYRYSAFGRTQILTPNYEPRTASLYNNPYTFTARRLDALDTNGSLQLYHYRARIYAPALGRFLQTDPIGYADAMNLYQYVLNNPANWIDPWGLFQFGYRRLSAAPPGSQYYTWFHPGARLAFNALNISWHHEAGFYEDGSGHVADYGGSGNNEDRSQYSMRGPHYDDDLMRQAQANVDATGDFKGGYRTFKHNCQDYCSALRKEYKRLYKELSKEQKRELKKRIKELKERMKKKKIKDNDK